VFVMNKQIEMHGRCGNIKHAAQIFHGMAKRDKDLVSWNTMLIAYAERGDLESAKLCFDSMPGRDQGFFADDVTFTSVLLGCSHQGGIVNAGSVFLSMIVDHGLTVRREQYGCVVDLLCRSVHLCGAKEVLLAMPFTLDS
ncbi:hypothetical protein SELMODRAFT_70599, partial [Selaginella moellendorffii]